jgi:uncharacterized protein YdiU (UPF0061 family)
VARALGLSEGDCRSEPFAQLLAGNLLLPGMDPFAACYGGHQFGSWAGQLGDGRVITLGEIRSETGERSEVQLKGAGRTPYSRAGDGRAVLRSSLREFVASEAMHHLGIPTTRALGLVTTGERVVRDMLYDGHPKEEAGAIVCRVAPSFLRFGSFELLTSRGDTELLRRLADYTIDTQYPELGAAARTPDTYAALFREVCRRTATLIAHWMRVGFVHGVMNTDNMSIVGLTLDYGPFGFLDHFDQELTPNTSDIGRYHFGDQPRVAKWNLLKLAEALLPLVDGIQPLQDGLASYDATFAQQSASMLAAKLGLREPAGLDTQKEDAKLTRDLFQILALVETDMTLFFRCLADVPVDGTPEVPAGELLRPLSGAYYDPSSLRGSAGERTVEWLRRYAERARRDNWPSAERRRAMQAANPKYVARGYLAQLAIDAAEEGDAAPLQELLDVLRFPYDEQPGRERFAQKRPEWARNRVGSSRVSCSS